MSGHSKWHNIRLRKGKQDAERGKTFTRLAKEIIMAAKDGGGNPDTNIRLRTAIEAARKSSMPGDNIKRAIQRGTGELEGVSYEELTYEGYGPAGSRSWCNASRTISSARLRTFGRSSPSWAVGWRNPVRSATSSIQGAFFLLIPVLPPRTN